MLDRLYYTLAEAQEILQTSRDGLKRLERARLIVLHALRHTAATALDTVRASKARQKAIMGHSPGDVTEGYIHPPLDELYQTLLESEREQLRWAA